MLNENHEDHLLTLIQTKEIWAEPHYVKSLIFVQKVVFEKSNLNFWYL